MSMYAEYHEFLGRLFSSVEPPFHIQVIHYDMAVHHRASVQRHLRVTDPSCFDDFRTIYLTSRGVGVNFSEHSSGVRGTPKQGSSSQRRHTWNRSAKLYVSIPTAVTSEDAEDLIGEPSVTKQPKLDNWTISKCQRFRRHFIWGREEAVLSRTALWTEMAKPMPSPPSEFLNRAACETVANNPGLFKIVTPVNVDRLQTFLSNHPN